MTADWRNAIESFQATAHLRQPDRTDMEADKARREAAPETEDDTMHAGAKYRDLFTDGTVRVITVEKLRVQVLDDSGNREWFPIADARIRFRSKADASRRHDTPRTL